jgi:hypothetical protein
MITQILRVSAVVILIAFLADVRCTPASASAAQCQDTGLLLVGISLHAQDDAVFAHGHFDLKAAKSFHAHLGAVIAAADKEIN